MLISLCPVAALKHSPSKRKSVKIKPGGAGGLAVPGQSSKTPGDTSGGSGGQDRSGAPPNNEGNYHTSSSFLI